MARRKEARKEKGGAAPVASLKFSGVNMALGGAGLVVVALGYWLLAQGSVSAAPVLLVLGYVVLLPLALIL